MNRDWRALGRRLLDLSVPLLAGILCAVIAANIDSAWYRWVVSAPIIDAQISGHPLSFGFLVNDLFMALFFGLAAEEIVLSLRPGGSLHPARRAANPIISSVGGVVAPAAIYVGLIHWFFRDVADHDLLVHAWAIPTATDIALVWLVAKLVFGASHPAVHFVLLLAIIDDFLGLIIIALFYGDGATHISWSAAAVPVGIGLAWLMRRAQLMTWTPYVFGAGMLVWYGLLHSPLHPALALVAVVPFFPRRPPDVSEVTDPAIAFQHAVSTPVTLGLFFFGFANGGVELGDITTVTWIVVASLLLGKTLGVTGGAFIADKLGMHLPVGMRPKHVVMTGFLASIGLTVALFMAGQALPLESPHQAAARMGALVSMVVVLAAVFVGRKFGWVDDHAD